MDFSVLEAALKCKILGLQSLKGGVIASAYRVETSKGVYFVKTVLNPPSGLFRLEAEGLSALRRVGAIRTPEVVHVLEGEENFLVLEYIEPDNDTSGAEFGTKFGEALAELHLNRPAETTFGLPYDNYIGLTLQTNSPEKTWAEFYLKNRLEPHYKTCLERNLLPASRQENLMKLFERTGDILGGMDFQPSLIHGDLWTGNLLFSKTTPVLFDPAVSYSHREAELAYMELFGDFPQSAFEAYRSVFPLDEGYAYRLPFHKLYQLLIHVAFYGERFGSQVDDVCDFYLR